MQRTLSAAILLLAVLALEAWPVRAAGKYAALVIDANTGVVLHAEAADEPRYPASLTKMMTLYLIFEQMEQGRLTPSTKIKISAEAAAAPPTRMNLEAGDEVALIDAIKGLITKSANDAAIALAEHITGSEARFAALMTERARQLGMPNTVFRNASGLPDPEQITTAHDMLVLALRLQDDFPRYYPLFATRAFTWGSKTYRNHNTLLGKFEGTDGIKTGYTHASGYNVAASVRRGNKHLIGAVFGGASGSVRDARIRLLFTRAFARASSVKTRKPQRLLTAQAEPRQRPAAARRPGDAVGGVPSPVPAVRPQRPNLDSTSERPVETSLSKARPRISIAKVRPVMLGQPTAQPLPAAEAMPARAAGSTTARPSAHERGEPGRAASTLESQAANLSRSAPALDTAPVTPPLPAQVHRPAIAKASTGSPIAAPPAGFELQVGAFASTGEAEKAVINARATAGGLLDAYGSRTHSVMRDKKQYFRARFTGFDAKTAASTCAELKKLQLDCLVMKAE